MNRRTISLATLLVLALLGVAIVVDVGPVNLARIVYRRAQKAADRRSRWLPPSQEVQRPAPSPADQERGFIVFQRSILARIYPTSSPLNDEPAASLDVQAAWDEREALQIGVRALRNLDSVAIDVSDLRDDAGDLLDHAAIDIRMERFYALPLSIRVRNRFGVVPKTLEPAVAIAIPENTSRPYWITVHVPMGQQAGNYRGTVRVSAGQHVESLPMNVQVLAYPLDEAPILLGPLSLPVLRAYTGPHSRNVQRIVDQADLVFRDVREHGMTTLSLWSGRFQERGEDGKLSVPDLDEALELFARYKFPQPLLYAPVNLLNTNKLGRSNNYRHYDADKAVPLARDIASTYSPRATALGIKGLILDPIEEPNYALGLSRHDAPDLRQRIATTLLKAIKDGGGTTVMTCTPETAGVGEGNLDYWLVAYKRFTRNVFERARRAGAHLAMYANATLTGNGTYFSRFFFGYYPWATHLSGLMAWTDASMRKRFPFNLDPKLAEGAHDVREGFLGSDGRPVPTIQWELAREGIDDLRYLVTIERLAARAHAMSAEAAALATQADSFLASIREVVSLDPHHYTFEDPHTLEPIPAVHWQSRDFAERRRQSFELLTRLVAVVGHEADR